jgi:hypothetical protein
MKAKRHRDEDASTNKRVIPLLEPQYKRAREQA